MFAYTPTGIRIASTKETVGATCAIQHGTLRLLPGNDLQAVYPDGTDHHDDEQTNVVEGGELIFVDADGDEWPACALVMLENDLDHSEDEQLPADLVAAAEARLEAWEAGLASEREARRYVIHKPEGGWRDRNSFTPEEKAMLRPAAEVLAILDGNAFFGMNVVDGDDVHYENYLPEAHALVESSGGWATLASFIRKDAPLPENPMGLREVRMIGDKPVVDLVDHPDVIVAIVGIEWDTTSGDGSELPEGMVPALPSELFAGVPADWGDDNRIVDLLSDHYGYCISTITGSVEPVDADGKPL